jgi:hypothetical protein
MLGRRLVDRWDLWAPSIDAIGGTDVYPMFARLAQKMRAATPAEPPTLSGDRARP